MGLIPQTKCGRCDRTYSGLRSRCPYCGAHRHKKGKRTTDGDNATWKLIIGVLLIVVLIAAVVVILVTSSNDKNNNGDIDKDIQGQPNNADDGTEGTGNQGAGNQGAGNQGAGNQGAGNQGAGNQGGEAGNGGEGGNGGESGNGGEGGNGGDQPTPPPTVIASSISAKSLYANPVKEFTVKIGETQPVTAIITPSNVTSIPVWSSDSDAVSVIPTDETGMKVNITGMSTGVANITVTVDSLDYTFIVRCGG